MLKREELAIARALKTKRDELEALEREHLAGGHKQAAALFRSAYCTVDEVTMTRKYYYIREYVITGDSNAGTLYVAKGRHTKTGLYWTADRTEARRFPTPADAGIFLERAKSGTSEMAHSARIEIAA